MKFKLFILAFFFSFNLHSADSNKIAEYTLNNSSTSADVQEIKVSAFEADNEESLAGQIDAERIPSGAETTYYCPHETAIKACQQSKSRLQKILQGSRIKIKKLIRGFKKKKSKVIMVAIKTILVGGSSYFTYHFAKGMDSVDTIVLATLNGVISGAYLAKEKLYFEILDNQLFSKIFKALTGAKESFVGKVFNWYTMQIFYLGCLEIAYFLLNNSFSVSTGELFKSATLWLFSSFFWELNINNPNFSDNTRKGSLLALSVLTTGIGLGLLYKVPLTQEAAITMGGSGALVWAARKLKKKSFFKKTIDAVKCQLNLTN